MNWVLFGVLIYVFAQLAIGLYVSRRMKTESDYYLAGRRLGTGIATMTIFATWFGAETCIGSSGAVYEEGLAGGRADPFGYTICLLLMGAVFAVPLYRRKLTTLGDLFRQRYSRSVEMVAVFVIAPSSVMWAGAQIRAFGQVIAASSAIGTFVAIAFAAAVVIIYTTSGGLLADAITDVIQGAALIIGLAVVLVAGVYSLGGVNAVMNAIDPARLSLVGKELNWLERIDTWAVPIFGSVLAQELIARTLASRSATIARRAAFGAAGIYFCVAAMPAMLALIGPSLVSELDDPEHFLPAVAQQLLPTLLYVMFAGALVSAILSTVDSALLAASSLVAHNVIVPMLPLADDRQKVRVARYTVIAMGFAAFLLALSAESVYSLVEDASAFGSSGILVVGTFALFTRYGRQVAATTALIAGSATWLIGNQYGVASPYLLSIAAALVLYLCVGWFEELHSEEPVPAVSEDAIAEEEPVPVES